MTGSQPGPVATVGDLLARLAGLPASTRLLVDGYENGFSPAELVVAEVQELDGMPVYYGEFWSVPSVARMLGPGGDWQLVTDGEVPPVPVGEPATAVILRRVERTD